METRFITASFAGLEGKFMVGRWNSVEVSRPYPTLAGYTFLQICGWNTGGGYALVMEIDGGAEGSIFRLGGLPSYDLNKRGLPHRVPGRLWEYFLAWLYAHAAKEGPGWFDNLPSTVNLATLDDRAQQFIRS